MDSALEILLLSFALTERSNSLGHSLKQANDKLKKQVKARTSELILTLGNLSEANKKLSIISIIDSLTGLHNRYHFDSTLEKEIGKAKTKTKTKTKKTYVYCSLTLIISRTSMTPMGI